MSASASSAPAGHEPARWDFWIDRGGTFTDVIGPRPAGHAARPQAPLRESRGLSRRRGAGHPRPARPRGRATPSRPASSATSAWAPRSPPTRCWSARASARCSSPRAASATRCASATRRARASSTRRSSSPSSSTPTCSRSPSACGPTARSSRSPISPRSARGLEAAKAAGFEAVAIVFMHAYRFPAHERQVAALAREIGFPQVSVSHEVSPLIKLVGRGDTTVVDAYLSPILSRYVAQVAEELRRRRSSGARLMFMMSSGGLTAADLFAGKDAILSGPAGGVVGAGRDGPRGRLRARHRLRHGRHLHRRRPFRRRVRARLRDRGRGRAHARADDADPHRRGRRRLDPAFRRRALPRRARLAPAPIPARSATGAAVRWPSPTPTSCSASSTRPSSRPSSARGRTSRSTSTACAPPSPTSPPRCAATASAHARGGRRRLRADRRRQHGGGHQEDLRRARLRRHAIRAQRVRRRERPACLPRRRRAGDEDGADPPVLRRCSPPTAWASPISAPRASRRSRSRSAPAALADAGREAERLGARLPRRRWPGRACDAGRHRAPCARPCALCRHGHVARGRRVAASSVTRERQERRSDAESSPSRSTRHARVQSFAVREHSPRPLRLHRREQGARRRGRLGRGGRRRRDSRAPHAPPLSRPARRRPPRAPASTRRAAGTTRRCSLRDAARARATSSPVPRSSSSRTRPSSSRTAGRPTLTAARPSRADPRRRAAARAPPSAPTADPVMLEIFNNLFMSIAEQMGVTLQNTAYSVNIKERLDFSCAVFDARRHARRQRAAHAGASRLDGQAPSRPIIRMNEGRIRPGDVYMLNAPYNGGTHLPDITVCTPVFDDAGREILFWVASRGPPRRCRRRRAGLDVAARHDDRGGRRLHRQLPASSRTAASARRRRSRC